MVMEVHELSEMLCKVQSGKFKAEIGDDTNDPFDADDYGMYPEWDDEFFDT